MHTLQLMYDIHTYTAKARPSFCDAVNRLGFRVFRPVYTRRNHTHCEAHLARVPAQLGGQTASSEAYVEVASFHNFDLSM